MFASVRFVEDNISAIVPTADIKKFQPGITDTGNGKKFKVKYSDGQYYKAYVVAVGETEGIAANKANEKRFRIPSKKIIDTASATSSDEAVLTENNENKNVPAVSKKITTQAIKKNISTQNFFKILNEPHSSIQTSSETDISEKDKRMAELLEENMKLKELNYALQNEIINKFQLHLNSFEAGGTRRGSDEKTLIVGYRNKENVHLGRGIWLPSHIFDSVCSSALRSKKNGDSLFIKELALAVYGRQVLVTHSVTGKKCNRLQTTPKPQLDQTKFMAICDIFKLRLENRGEKEPEKIVKSVNTWIAEKIHDMTRRPKPRKNETKNDEQFEHDEIDEDETINDILNAELQILD